jgi:hypothetical protein
MAKSQSSLALALTSNHSASGKQFFRNRAFCRLIRFRVSSLPSWSSPAPHKIDRLTAVGVRFDTVLADAGYEQPAAFRQGLSGRGLTWAAGIPKHQEVYPYDVKLIFPASGYGHCASIDPRHPLGSRTDDPDFCSLEEVSWRRGTTGCLTARFAALRTLDGGGYVAGHSRQGTAARAREGILAGWRVAIKRRAQILSVQLAGGCDIESAGERRQSAMGLRAGASADERGAWHFKMPSWQGLHRHALGSMNAYSAFLEYQRLRTANRRK